MYHHNAHDILLITSLHSLSIQEVQCHARAIIKYLLPLLPSLIITSYCLYQFTNAKGMGMPGPPSLWIYWYITWLLVNDSKFEFWLDKSIHILQKKFVCFFFFLMHAPQMTVIQFEINRTGNACSSNDLSYNLKSAGTSRVNAYLLDHGLKTCESRKVYMHLHKKDIVRMHTNNQ